MREGGEGEEGGREGGEIWLMNNMLAGSIFSVNVISKN